MTSKQKRRRRSYLATKRHPKRYARHLQQGRVARKSVRVWLAEYKIAQGCKDCGYNKHSAALELDHEGPKTCEISDCRSSIARLKKEIELGKCVVRCAIHHAIKTWCEKNDIPYDPTNYA